MSNLPLFSIITPTFNASRYLEQTFASVADQKYPALEYIVVDGGSTDGTLDIIRANEGLVTRWISEPDKGISDAFNKGVRMATGEIIGIINADDYYHPGALAAVARACSEQPDFDVYHGDAIYERFDGSGVFRFRPKKDIGTVIWRRMPISHPSTFIRKTAYERYGFYDARYRLTMDYDLVLRMFCNRAKFHHIDAVLAHYRYGQPCGNKGNLESRQIVIEHGLSPLVAEYYYCEAIAKTWVKSLFSRVIS